MGGSSPASSQDISFKSMGSWVTMNPTVNETLPDPRQSLTYSFIHQITYETTDAGLTLGLEVLGQGDAFDDLQLKVEVINFSSIIPLGPGGSAGSSGGPQTYTFTSGPRTILSNITRIQATANIRVTVTLSTKYALSGGRAFVFRYSLS